MSVRDQLARLIVETRTNTGLPPPKLVVHPKDYDELLRELTAGPIAVVHPRHGGATFMGVDLAHDPSVSIGDPVVYRDRPPYWADGPFSFPNPMHRGTCREYGCEEGALHVLTHPDAVIEERTFGKATYVDPGWDSFAMEAMRRKLVESVMAMVETVTDYEVIERKPLTLNLVPEKPDDPLSVSLLYGRIVVRVLL